MKTTVAFLLVAVATASAQSAATTAGGGALRGSSASSAEAERAEAFRGVLEVLAPVLGAEDNPQQQLHDRRLHVWARTHTKAQLDGSCNWWISHFAKMGVSKKDACGWVNTKTLSLPGICPDVCPMSDTPHLCSFIAYDRNKGKDAATVCGALGQGGGTCKPACCKRQRDYCYTNANARIAGGVFAFWQWGDLFKLGAFADRAFERCMAERGCVDTRHHDGTTTTYWTVSADDGHPTVLTCPAGQARKSASMADADKDGTPDRQQCVGTLKSPWEK